MLFDLEAQACRAGDLPGPRRAHGAVGLIGLGIGGSANGGIFDALGIGGGGGGSSDPQYDDQINKANASAAVEPEATRRR